MSSHEAQGKSLGSVRKTVKSHLLANSGVRNWDRDLIQARFTSLKSTSLEMNTLDLQKKNVNAFCPENVNIGFVISSRLKPDSYGEELH